jgi:hypothetical protein
MRPVIEQRLHEHFVMADTYILGIPITVFNFNPDGTSTSQGDDSLISDYHEKFREQ